MIGGVRKRAWNEKTFYGVGTVYLLGLSAGGAWGFYEGIRNPDVNTTRLRFNSVLNSMTRRGPFLGNSLGVICTTSSFACLAKLEIIALMYHCIDGVIVQARGGTDEIFNSAASGTLAGLAFKSTAGLKAAGLAGVIGGVGITAFSFISDALGL